jgi:heme-degrading monooxygenase HmoA
MKVEIRCICQGNVIMNLIEMDERITFSEQLEEDVGSVVVISKFNIKPEDIDKFLKSWASGAKIMKQQPGFISTQLHRGIASSSVFVNYTVFETAEYFKRASNNPDFQSKLSDYPVNTVVSPHLFKKVVVPGICVG